MTTLAEQLAGRICSLSFETLPADVVEHAKRCVLDQLGIQILGQTFPASQAAMALARSVGAAPAVSRVPGLGEAVSAPYAALAAAAFGHSCEFDDCHFLCGHPGACVIPPALALSQQEGLGGREFVTAVVAGYEAMVLAVGPIHHHFAMTGWQGSKIGGVFGAAGASALLLGLGETQMAHALAIAGSEASGTLEYDRAGGDVKRLFPAMAARSGVEAALLARSGLTGPLTILEGERGIYRLFGDGTAPRIESIWGTEFHIREAFFKLDPAAGTHLAPIEALRCLITEHELKAEDVAKIVVAVAPFAVRHGGDTGQPAGAVSAQYNLGFSMALRLVDGNNAIQSYLDPAKWADPAIVRVSEAVVVESLSLEPGESPLGARVDIVCRSGAVLSRRQQTFRGHTDDPACWEDLERKFRGLVAHRLSTSQTDAIVKAVAELEQLPDVGDLVDLTVGTSS